ncbi:hypothetical protein [Granulicella sp. dw_53]|uniref:hypothetical protein n=1 Tax=Granulicella sp. dw_53 TaxID=2719792 RepID=UPI001BD2DF56|nr:hypothetical protein [Granulicella sp. dw_53]
MPIRSKISTRLLLALAAVLLVVALLWLRWPAFHKGTPPSLDQSAPLGSPPAATAEDPTAVYAHNLLLRKGSTFRVYIRWIRGQMLPTHPGVNPSLDDPKSFIFVIQKGVVHANLGDIGNYLNSAVPAKFPLQKINITGEGDQLKISGILHKLMLPLPVEMASTVSSTSDGRIHLHVTKINVLKVPVKALLGGLHVQIDDVMGSTPLAGVQVSGNDLFFDTPKLLPPPYIRGQLTGVSVDRPDLVLIYGNSRNDEARLAQWHNFLKLTGGTLDFGKLTMHNADLTLVDASDDAWFDLDLVNYQAQLVDGISRMTPQAGLEMFMPDVDQQRQNKSGKSITLEWLRNRNQSLPPDIPVKKPDTPVKK